MITIYEALRRNQSTQLLANIHMDSINLFPSGRIVVSYNGLELKIRDSVLSDMKTLKIHSTHTNNQFSLSRIDDRHNWIGKFELVQDGDWYYLERIED